MPMLKTIGNHISIHALREEGDLFEFIRFIWLLNFYPRPPRGGRLLPFSTWNHPFIISIHALREEGDQSKTLTRIKAP